MGKVKRKYRLLMATTFIISGCSMCYELIISAVSSYLLGNSLLQYSLTIGVYMSALGLGSYLSKYLTKNLFNQLIKIEILIAIIGGFSALLLFFANLYLSNYEMVMYGLTLTIGTLAGAEIPLLTRIIEEDEQNLKLTLSSIFSFDYLGGLIGAVAFPLLMIPTMGYFATAFLCGGLNIVASLLILWRYEPKIRHARRYRYLAWSVAVLMLGGIFFGEELSGFVEKGLYQDTVILNTQTAYQKVVMTKHRDDTRLFIDGNCQFSSLDEYRYHEALVHIPMSQASRKKQVLLLGGGDGLAVRELLKYDVEQIDLVDLDAQIIEICRNNKHITAINQNSLNNDKVSIHIMDAFEYVEQNKKKYDVIIIDLPDPNSEVLNKLYSNVFYALCKKSLSEDGVLVTQSTSPYFTPKSFWCISKTLESVGFYVKPYHLEVPSFGDWGFNLAMNDSNEQPWRTMVDTKYLSNENIPALFLFAKDELAQNVEINRLTRPRLMVYYNEEVRKLD